MESLLENATRRTKLTDFGNDSFIEPLQRLLASINASAGLHPFGASLARTMLGALLCNRLYVEKAWSENPDLARRVIRRPVVILGLPRTGTTSLFNLLAGDPVHRYLTNWESSRPAPPPGRWHGKPVVRRAVSFLGLSLQHYLAPSLHAIHETKIDGPEECTSLLMAQFASLAFGATFNVPEYLAWLDDYDFTPVARYHLRQLKLIDSQRTSTRWLLKSPNHLSGLGALLEAYPDACIVHVHRDPVDVISSACSLVAAFRGIFTDRLNYADIRSQTVQTLKRSLRRATAAREAAPPNQFFDVYYDDLMAEPVRVVRELYRHFELDLYPLAETRIREAVVASARTRRRRHTHTVERFGIDRAAVRSTFDWYTSRFNVPTHR